MRRVKLVEGDLLGRFERTLHTRACFICSLEVTPTLGSVRLVCSWDSHFRIAHMHCVRLILKYAQAEIDRQNGVQP
jgi:hypothetical protein